MKITIDALPILGQAGGRSFNYQLIKKLLYYKNDYSYCLAFRLRRKITLNEFNYENVKLHRIFIPNRILEYIWTFNSIKIPGDFLFCNPNIFVSTIYFIPYFKKSKVISFLYDITTLKIKEYFSHREEFIKRMNNLIKKSDIIVSISNYTKQDFCNYFNYHGENIKVIYPSVDDSFSPIINSDYIKSVISKYKLNFKKYILYVGNISYHKNINRLIDSFLKIRNKELKLVLCGKTYWGDFVLDRIKKENLSDKVIVTGYVDDKDLVYLYNGALCFCYISLYEGFGLPVLESMACGIPVIVSNTTSLPEVVGDAGIKVNPLDVDEIAFWLNKVIEDDELRRKLSKLVLERVSLFLWKNTIEELDKIIKSL